VGDGDQARLFHRLTEQAPERAGTAWPLREVDDPRLVTSFRSSDLDLLPPWVKVYEDGLTLVPLPRELPTSGVGTIATLAGRPARPAALDLAQLARLLHLSAGIVRTEARPSWPGGSIPFRAAGSAGGRFPLEVYAVVPEGTADLPPGVHSYRPVEHALLQVAPPPAGETPALVVTGVPWRTGWKYRERGYRHVFWDAGTMLSQVLALAAGAGLQARLFTAFPDLELGELVGADGIDELPVALVALGDGVPGWTPAARAVPGSVGDPAVEFPLVSSAHRAGIASGWGDPRPAGDPVPDPLPDSPPVNDVIYRRGSTRRMDASRTIPRGAMEAALAVSLRGIDVPHFVAVHGVDGVEPGLYRWPDLARPSYAGNLRDELYHVATGQGLAGDAAFVVIGAADLTAISDRGYRDLQLAAGLVEGRLHLAAYALGYGASGMTFLDSEIPGLLREDLAGLLFTCVGVPEYANKAGGPPGEPSHVRRVVPRVEE
jgi:SagB-type dehydrogenase family enzyme